MPPPSSFVPEHQVLLAGNTEMASKVTIPDKEEGEEEEDDWSESRLVNIREAKKYTDCINDVFENNG